MLVNVTRRGFAIESEADALVNWQEAQVKPKKGSSSPSKSGGETPIKRKLQGRSRDDAEEGGSCSKRSRLTDDRGLKGDSSSCSSSSSSGSTASSPVSTPSFKSQTLLSKDSKAKSKSKNLTVS